MYYFIKSANLFTQQKSKKMCKRLRVLILNIRVKLEMFKQKNFNFVY